MGKKYTIELERGETAYKTVDSNGTPLIQLAPTPYTEPDMEKIREEAYEDGYKTAKVQCNIQAEKDLREVGERHYQKGLSDAWAAARKIADMPYGEEEKVFGSGGWHFITQHTASEAIKKIRQYEQKQEEIHLGDEVTFLPNNAKGIVSECHVPDVYSDNDKYAVWCGETMEYVLKQHLTRTGRTFPEIVEVMRKMKEG